MENCSEIELMYCWGRVDFFWWDCGGAHEDLEKLGAKAPRSPNTTENPPQSSKSWNSQKGIPKLDLPVNSSETQGKSTPIRPSPIKKPFSHLINKFENNSPKMGWKSSTRVLFLLLACFFIFLRNCDSG
jgi:hypothetical protein